MMMSNVGIVEISEKKNMSCICSCLVLLMFFVVWCSVMWWFSSMRIVIVGMRVLISSVVVSLEGRSWFLFFWLVIVY